MTLYFLIFIDQFIRRAHFNFSKSFQVLFLAYSSVGTYTVTVLHPSPICSQSKNHCPFSSVPVTHSLQQVSPSLEVLQLLFK